MNRVLFIYDHKQNCIPAFNFCHCKPFTAWWLTVVPFPSEASEDEGLKFDFVNQIGNQFDVR